MYFVQTVEASPQYPKIKISNPKQDVRLPHLLSLLFSSLNGSQTVVIGKACVNVRILYLFGNLPPENKKNYLGWTLVTSKRNGSRI